VLYTGIAVVWPGYEGGSAALLSNETIQILQFVLIGLGLAASLYTAYKIARNNSDEGRKGFASFAPYAALLVILSAVNIYLFTLPMSMRM